MKRIVPWQIFIICVTVGTYVAVRASGSDQIAAAFAIATAFAIAIAIATEEPGIPKRWSFTVYGVEAVAIYGLVTGSVGWAIAIAMIGIMVLLAVWHFGPVAGSLAATTGEKRADAALDPAAQDR